MFTELILSSDYVVVLTFKEITPFDHGGSAVTVATVHHHIKMTSWRQLPFTSDLLALPPSLLGVRQTTRVLSC